MLMWVRPMSGWLKFTPAAGTFTWMLSGSPVRSGTMPTLHTTLYLERKQAEGKSRREAIRCLKRQLARVVFNTLKASPALT
jgi:hypothetical protein